VREELDPGLLEEAERLQAYPHLPPHMRDGPPEEKPRVVLPDINPHRTTHRGEPSFVSSFADNTMRRGSLLQHVGEAMTYPNPEMNPFGRKKRRKKKLDDPVFSTHGRQP